MLKNELRLLLAGTYINNVKEYGSLEEVYKIKQRSYSNLDKELDYMEKNNIKMTDYFSEDYPVQLKNIEYPPLVLFIKGEFKETELPIAVVGTRYPSGYGESVVKYLVTYLIKSGFSIISGMARGIDALAHRETIKNNGYTIAVLGSGIDVIYPEENKKIYKEITQKGCIISEFPLGTKPNRYNFPRRNRIIAGLAKGSVIVEADIKSGSLITARITEEQSKPVFAVPGEIFSKRSKGTNKLIYQGSIAVNDIDAILSYFYLELKKEAEKIKQNERQSLSEDEKNVMDILEGEMSIDELILKTYMDISALSDILFDLEIKGLIVHTPSDGYRKL